MCQAINRERFMVKPVRLNFYSVHYFFVSNVRHFMIHIFTGCFIKMSFLSNFEPEISTSAPLTCAEHSSLILICALKVFTEAFVHKSLFTAGFMWHFIPVNVFFLALYCILFSDL